MHERILSSSSLICICDFYAPSIAWASLSLTGYEEEISKGRLHFSLCFGLKQLVEANTRGDSVLDIVFVSAHLLDNGYECEVTDYIYDHRAVLVPISVPGCNNRYAYSTFPDFSRAADASIMDLLSDSFDDLNSSAYLRILIFWWLLPKILLKAVCSASSF